MMGVGGSSLWKPLIMWLFHSAGGGATSVVSIKAPSSAAKLSSPSQMIMIITIINDEQQNIL
jgi:hypothetical protein